MDFLLIAVLTVLNGIFAMSEMAVATSRKARLEAMAEAGDKGARVALELQEHPTRFLSTVQVGITSIGILNGIIGEAAFSAAVAAWLAGLGLGEKAAGVTATAVVVTLITFVTIVFGELVPKRIGQMYPETVARWISPPMNWLAKMAAPFVKLLSMTTQAVLKLVGLDRHKGLVVTQEEIDHSLAEGVHAGLIEEHEHQMVRNVFHLDDRQLISLMTPRTDIIWFDAHDSVQTCLQRLGWMASSPDAALHASHSWYPVCKLDLDNVVGVVSVSGLLAAMHVRDPADVCAVEVQSIAVPAVFVPETLTGLEVLEQFRERASRIMFVVDEYGSVQGLLTPRDLLEGIAGELKSAHQEQAWALLQGDGTWILDGVMPVSELKIRLSIQTLPHEGKDRYNTLAGLLMSVCGHLPEVGSTMHIEGWQFEVLKMAGRRIDQVLARRATNLDDA